MFPLFLVSYLLDLLVGDLGWMPHPVVGIGKTAGFLERVFFRGGGRLSGRRKEIYEKILGLVLTIIITACSFFIVLFLVRYAYNISRGAGIAAAVFMGYFTISARGLDQHARAVSKEIKRGDLSRARDALSKIVGRDTAELAESETIRACVESVAESTVDGVLAPLFYLMLGGPALAFAYKAVNTLDSMVGYKDHKYNNFGWASARLDDIFNFLPARIAGLIIPVASFILKKNYKSSFKIMLRDGGAHSSPNSGIPEAAVAGALDVRLGGTSFYKGKASNKPYIGDSENDPAPIHIHHAIQLMYASSALLVLIGALIWLW